MIRLGTCTAADTAHLVQALNECLYQGYRFRVVMTAKRFLEDARVHDVDLTSTFLALDGDRPVGVALTARRGDLAWIAGMGVHPDLRGRGLGQEMLVQVKERLAEVGARRVLLEVLVDNPAARACYDKAGLVPLRRYYCFRGTSGQAGPAGEWKAARTPATWIIDQHEELHPAEQCWQRNLPTLDHRSRGLTGLAIHQGDRIAASMLYSESAVQDVGYRPGGPPLAELFPALLTKAFGSTRPFAIVNVPDDDPLFPVMRASGFEVYAEQLDMRCDL